MDLEVAVDATRIECQVTCSRGVRKAFLSDEFAIEYASPIDGAGESVAAIPVVAMAAPIAWLFGADIHVETLDATYLDALNGVKQVFESFYPRFRCASSHLVVEQPVVNHAPPTGGRTGQLFTAGVDSMATFLRHRAERPELFTIATTEYPSYLPDAWSTREAHLRRFAASEETAIHFIDAPTDHTNAAYLLWKSRLRNWWSQVSHAMVLTGLCAPLTVLRGISTLYIASSQVEHAYGSHPLIDDQLRWAGTRVVHDAPQLSRLDKVRYLTRFPSILPHLLCLSPALPEKTARTISQLLVCGVDPHDIPFEGDIEAPLRRAQQQFTRRAFDVSERLIFWKNIQATVPDPLPHGLSEGVTRYLTWLRGFDFANYTQRSAPAPLTSLRLFARAHLNYHFPAAVYRFRRGRARLRGRLRSAGSEGRDVIDHPPAKASLRRRIGPHSRVFKS